MTTKKTTLKSVFLTGLLVLVPLAITLWVLGLIIGTMDQTLLLLPQAEVASTVAAAATARNLIFICRPLAPRPPWST